MTEEKSLYDQIMQIADENDEATEKLKQVAVDILTMTGFHKPNFNIRVEDSDYGRVTASIEIQGMRWVDGTEAVGGYFPVFMVTEEHVKVFSASAIDTDYIVNFDHGDKDKIIKTIKEQILEYAKSGELVKIPVITMVDGTTIEAADDFEKALFKSMSGAILNPTEERPEPDEVKCDHEWLPLSDFGLDNHGGGVRVCPHCNCEVLYPASHSFEHVRRQEHFQSLIRQVSMPEYAKLLAKTKKRRKKGAKE